MPKKEDTPLQALVKESDAPQKKVSAFDKECTAYLKKKDKADPSQGKELYQKCQDHVTELEDMQEKLENLNQEDEEMKANKFEGKIKDETKKYKTIEEKLNKLLEKLKPEEEEEDEEEESGEEESVEEEEEEESEEEESEEVGEWSDEEEGDSETEVKKPIETKEKLITKSKPTPSKHARPAVAGKSKAAAVESQEEEETEEEDETEEGSEEEEEEEEETEQEEESLEEEEEEESEEETEEEEESEEESEDEETDLEQTSTMRQYIALDDFDGQEKGDLGFKKGEILTIIMARSDGWLEAENKKGKKGLVPITYLQVYNQYKDVEDKESEEGSGSEDDEEPSTTTPRTPRKGRDLWKDIKSAVHETSATDVLHALGAMPAGFRQSTLSIKSKQAKYSIRSMLTPKLSASCVSFRDLFLDNNTDMLRPRTVKIQKIITIIQAKQIPLPGTVKGENGAEVLSRHARVCLFDGKDILSNIHVIKVSSTDKEQKIWNFNNKVSDVKHSIEFGEVFMRTNSTEANLGVLVELCVTFRRTSNNQEGELSCGWVHFKLYDQDGKQMASKTYDEFVNGGTIYERGVDVDPSVGKKAGTSKFRTLVAGNKQPRLSMRIADPTKDQKIHLDTMPDVLVSSTSYISYISYYRHIQADLLLRDREDQQSSELIYGPILNAFPDVLEQPDIMDILRNCWADELKTVKRNEKKEMAALKDRFRKVFFTNVYPLTQCASLPKWDVAHGEVVKTRFDEIQRLYGMNKGQKVPLSLLSSEVVHKPLDISSLGYNLINPHCMVKSHGV